MNKSRQPTPGCGSIHNLLLSARPAALFVMHLGDAHEYISDHTVGWPGQDADTCTFDVPEQQAQEHAAEMVALAEGWGSTERAQNLDWSYRIKKDLDQKLQWKSEAEHEAFRRQEQQQHKAYDFLIRRPPRA